LLRCAAILRPRTITPESGLENWLREVSGCLDDLAQDLRYAGRTLIAHKAFTATAVTTLALGIGATTAIFSVVSALVLRPLPFPDPDRLVQMHGSSALTPRGDAVGDLETYRQESTSFEALVGYAVSARYLRDSLGAERVMAVQAEGDFFTMLGVPASKGRTFRTDDPPSAAVISDAFWRRLGGNPSIIGSSLNLDDQLFTVMGVMPDWFQFPYGAASLLPGALSEARTDVWIQLDPPMRTRPRGRIGSVTGRLKPNVSLEAADSELAAIAARLAARYPDTNTSRGVYLEPLADAVVARPIRRALFLLFGAVGLLLALACANVANLSLARMTLRSREVAVRAALGAGGFRLIRQLLTESLLLSLLGGTIGLAIAWWGTGEVVRLASVYLPRAQEVRPGITDWRVFAFLLAACTATGAALGLAPALVAVRRDTQSVLQDTTGRSTMSVGQRHFRDALVVAEVAIAFLLAIGASLLIRELIRLRNTNPGITTSNVVTFHLGHRMSPQTDVTQFYRIEERVRQVEGVRAAGLIQMLPLQNSGWTSNSSDFVVRGRPPISPVFPIQLRYVTPGYFETLGIPIEQGRGFTTRDDRDASRVILVNRTLARRYVGDEDPTGRDTTRGMIAGVVGDVRQAHLDRPAAPEIYYPVAQNWSQLSELGMTLVVRTRDRPEAVIEPVRAAVREVSPNLAIFNVKTMERVVAESLSDFTLYLSLMAAFAGLALVLALTGTYGVIAYIASSRTKEFAIRVALGANMHRVTRLVVGQGMRLTGIGLALGLLAALAATPLLEGLPVTVRPPDLVTIAPVALVIGLVALTASFLPARRAARIDPMLALRDE
jgi:putative ABC transport system permease protein